MIVSLCLMFVVSVLQFRGAVFFIIAVMGILLFDHDDLHTHSDDHILMSVDELVLVILVNRPWSLFWDKSMFETYTILLRALTLHFRIKFWWNSFTTPHPCLGNFKNRATFCLIGPWIKNYEITLTWPWQFSPDKHKHHSFITHLFNHITQLTGLSDHIVSVWGHLENGQHLTPHFESSGSETLCSLLLA